MDPDTDEAEASIREFASWLGPKPDGPEERMRWAVRAGAFRTILRRTMNQVDKMVPPPATQPEG